MFIVLGLLISGVLIIGVFYLIIRMKDVYARLETLTSALGTLNQKFPLTEESRRQASETIARLNERMGSLNQKAAQIDALMGEVVNLRMLFTMPKRAGGAGERLLEKALHDILSTSLYQTQYQLSSGIVDCVIKLKENIVPIDSKLSLENFSKMLGATDDQARRTFWRAFTADVKKRIDETSKYILPAERTTDFALMYIASESVYYEAFIKDRQFGEENALIDYAIRKKVYPVSPQTIYPYLITVVQGMKALKIEENAQAILGKVAGLRNDFDRFLTIYNIIISHIDDAHKKHAGDGQGALRKLEHHISQLEQKAG